MRGVFLLICLPLLVGCPTQATHRVVVQGLVAIDTSQMPEGSARLVDEDRKVWGKTLTLQEEWQVTVPARLILVPDDEYYRDTPVDKAPAR